MVKRIIQIFFCFFLFKMVLRCSLDIHKRLFDLGICNMKVWGANKVKEEFLMS